MQVALARQELDHGDVVGEGCGGAYELVKVSRECQHLLEGFIEFLGCAEVMLGKNQSCPGAQLLKLFWFALRGSLYFNINQLAADGGGFAKDIELRGDGTTKLPSTGNPPASCDRYRAVMGFEKTLDFRESQARLGKVVQPELQQGVIARQGLGPFAHLIGVGAGHCHAYARQPVG